MLQKFSDMLLVFLTCIFYSTSSEDLHNKKYKRQEILLLAYNKSTKLSKKDI